MKQSILVFSMRKWRATFLFLALLLAAWQEAALALTITRGPYLQSGTPTSVIVRWRTDTATNSRVWYGTTPGSLTSFADNATVTTEHEVLVSGLDPNTSYYYAVGSSTTTLAGNNADYFFLTAPSAGTAVPTRIWVLGDAGTQTAAQRAVRDAYDTFTGTRHTNLWLMLGDNAYATGTDAEYQGAVFNMYPEMLRKSVLWSTRGNHEATDATGSVYYNAFTFTRNGEAGGVASGTEAYYSFDYGNIHFINLDSQGSSRSATGAMATWLKNDLAATTRDWVIAFWHHPPYSKGSHNSDTEGQLIDMRQNILPILESYGVDLVLTGHSHSYERSFLLDGHYGSSGTLTSAMKKDPGNGREDGTGAYKKPTLGPAPHEGAVYVVAGSSGQASGGSLNHPAMVISLNSLGSLVIDVTGPRMDVKFLRETGAIPDYFTLIKGPASVPDAPSGLTAIAGNAEIALTWNPSSGAESYSVKRAPVSGGPYGVIAAGVTAIRYTDTNVANGTTYYYVVSAANTLGEGPDSSQTSATPQLPTPPNPPLNLTATAVSTNQINLAWLDNSNNESGFRIDVSTDGVTFLSAGSVGPGVTRFSHTGLLPSTQYTYRVYAFNAAGHSDPAVAGAATLAGPPPGSGTGLRGDYYDKRDFTSFKFTRTDPTIHFNWGSGAPASGMGSDTFSIRWTGEVEPEFSETYTFHTTTSDGVRLWVNGVLIINKWIDQSTREWSGTISLTGGQRYTIRMEYYEKKGSATARLSWSSPSTPKAIIPQSRLYP